MGVPVPLRIFYDFVALSIVQFPDPNVQRFEGLPPPQSAQTELETFLKRCFTVQLFSPIHSTRGASLIKKKHSEERKQDHQETQSMMHLYM